ncbi:UDP-glucose 6-dehydrogenase TuaD [compost metagenome]
MEETQRIYGYRDDLRLCGTKEAALRGADALVIVTEWPVFKTLDIDMVEKELKELIVFDGRNLFDVKRMIKKGVTYYSIGR